jgi:uridine nucleosidase
MAAHSPKLKLLGVSTVHGNASLQNTTKNSLSILEAIGKRDVPVYPGAAKPFCREAVHAEAIHGARFNVRTTMVKT